MLHYEASEVLRGYIFKCDLIPTAFCIHYITSSQRFWYQEL